MAWTKNPPTKPGWHWYRYPGDEGPEIVRVRQLRFGLSFAFTDVEEWYPVESSSGKWWDQPLIPPTDEGGSLMARKPCKTCGVDYETYTSAVNTLMDDKERELCQLRADLEAGNLSDGHHTHNELYAYRMAYNAALFNCWASAGVYDVHKSTKHSDGEDCFGGGWFIVVAQLPSGQISNHYRLEHWDLFRVPIRETAEPYDGHTPEVALERLMAFSIGQYERTYLDLLCTLLSGKDATIRRLIEALETIAALERKGHDQDAAAGQIAAKALKEITNP